MRKQAVILLGLVGIALAGCDFYGTWNGAGYVDIGDDRRYVGNMTRSFGEVMVDTLYYSGVGCVANTLTIEYSYVLDEVPLVSYEMLSCLSDQPVDGCISCDNLPSTGIDYYDFDPECAALMTKDFSSRIVEEYPLRRAYSFVDTAPPAAFPFTCAQDALEGTWVGEVTSTFANGVVTNELITQVYNGTHLTNTTVVSRADDLCPSNTVTIFSVYVPTPAGVLYSPLSCEVDRPGCGVCPEMSSTLITPMSTWVVGETCSELAISGNGYVRLSRAPPLSTAAIIGIVVGGVVLVGAIVGLAVWLVRRRSAKAGEQRPLLVNSEEGTSASA